MRQPGIGTGDVRPSRARGDTARLLACALALLAHAPSAAQTFVAAYGASGYENAAAIVHLSDGLMVAGSSDSSGAGGLDGLLIRVGRCGEHAWAATYGGSGDDAFFAAAPTDDGGALAVGQTDSFSASLDFWLVRVAADGSVAWELSLGGSGDDRLRAVTRTTDGFVVVGETTGPSGQDAWVARLDPLGNVIWQRSIGGPADDRAAAVAVDPGGALVVAGASESFGAGFFDAWVLLLDGDGALVWQRTFGDFGDDSADAVAALPGGGYLAAGSTDSTGEGLFDIWVARLGQGGAPLWQRTFGDADENEAFAIWSTHGGRSTIAGSTRDPELGTSASVLLALDPDGLDLWQRRFGGGADDYTSAGTGLGGARLALAGSTRSFGAGADDAWVVAADAEGRVHPACSATSPVALTGAAFSGAGPSSSATTSVTHFVAASNGVTATSAALASSIVCATTPGEVSAIQTGQPLLFTSAVHLTWEPAAAACAESFDLYRGDGGALSSGDYGACLASGLIDPGFTDTDEPEEGVTWTYLVAGEGNGVKGGLGFDSLGFPRQPLAACP